MGKTYVSAASLVVMLCLASGCASSRATIQEALPADTARLHCEPPPSLGVLVSYPGVPESAPLPSPSARRLPPDIKLSPQARNIAEIIGLSELLVEIATQEGREGGRTDSERIRLLELHQQLSNRLMLTSFEVSSAAAEVACEETRADHVADRLQEIEEKRVRRNLIISIVGDAAIGIVGGGLTLVAEEFGAGIAEIVGGVLATSFGLAAFAAHETTRFPHRRNLLREVWEGPDHPKLFPPSVWRYLTTTTDEGPTLRESLIADWRRHEFLGKPGSDTEKRRLALIFGEGGVYDIDELRLRAEMFDLLKTATRLMNQDLHVLFRELLIAKNTGSL